MLMNHFFECIQKFQYNLINVQKEMKQNCIDGSSFSSEEDLYRTRREQTTQIKDGVLLQSNIYQSYKDSIQKLQKTQEELINTKAQLEIAQNTTQLMEAEFSFQRAQYEEEIIRLKKSEDELRTALLNSQAEIYMFKLILFLKILKFKCLKKKKMIIKLN